MSGKRILDNNQLLREKVWALLSYPDGSEFCFQTTLNADILRELGITLEENKLPRLDKTYYWNGRNIYRQFSVVGVKVSLWDAMTYTHEPSYQLSKFF